MNSWINLTAIAKILGVGLLAGAGLPAVFAVGLRALSPSSAASGGRVGAVGAGSMARPAKPVGVAIACLCFAVVLAAVAYGIYLIVMG